MKNLESGTKLLGAGILVLLLSGYAIVGRLFDLLCLGFLICRSVIMSPSHRIFIRIKWVSICKALRIVHDRLALCKCL